MTAFVDEKKLKIHELYRERIVQEDNLIDNRMIWMIASQAFLFAIWGGLLQSVVEQYPNMIWLARGIPIVGIVFAFGSSLSIKAAQDQIDRLRADYLLLFPIDEVAVTSRSIYSAIWSWAKKFPKSLVRFLIGWIKYLSRINRQFSYSSDEVLSRRRKLRRDPLPGLTGLSNFHGMGHIVPKFMPFAITLVWGFVFWMTCHAAHPLSAGHGPLPGSIWV